MSTRKLMSLWFFVGLFACVAAQGQSYFVKSDDYKDGEEVVNVFLKEADYSLMVEDIERNGENFDWGWVKTATATDTEAPAEPATKTRRLMGRFRRNSGPNPARPKELGFDLSTYKTVSVDKVANHAGLIPPTTPDAVRESFVLAMKEIGLEVVQPGEKADLDLGIAIVDYKRDSTFIYVATVQPFIELEVRVRDTAKDENLILLRNQAHSDTPEGAALNYASTLLKFLR